MTGHSLVPMSARAAGIELRAAVPAPAAARGRARRAPAATPDAMATPHAAATAARRAVRAAAGRAADERAWPAPCSRSPALALAGGRRCCG
ncbi:MAG: hypothetical protein MZW92_23370 [Comamonadaceae bacterium]|nr:hypothetical protein [Comamonadaceae bacterium]